VFSVLPLLAALPAAIHASVLVGISAWNKTPWIVGVIYAGIYFFSSIFAMILGASIDSTSAVTDSTLRHLSLEGTISGIAENLLDAAPGGFSRMVEQTVIPAMTPLLLIAAFLIVGGVLAARARIRAVEIVQG
jgi:hypothetical protein